MGFRVEQELTPGHLFDDPSLSDIDVQFPTPSDCDLVFNASGPSFPPVPVVAPNPWPALVSGLILIYLSGGG